MMIICILNVSHVSMLDSRPPDSTEDLTGIPQQVHPAQWLSGMYDPVVGEWEVQSG
jgi:hypothetical protein